MGLSLGHGGLPLPPDLDRARLPADERRRVEAALAPLVAPFAAEALRVDAVCLFEQPTRDEPFVQIARYALGSAGAAVSAEGLTR